MLHISWVVFTKESRVQLPGVTEFCSWVRGVCTSLPRPASEVSWERFEEIQTSTEVLLSETKFWRAIENHSG